MEKEKIQDKLIKMKISKQNLVVHAIYLVLILIFVIIFGLIGYSSTKPKSQYIQIVPQKNQISEDTPEKIAEPEVPSESYELDLDEPPRLVREGESMMLEGLGIRPISLPKLSSSLEDTGIDRPEISDYILIDDVLVYAFSYGEEIDFTAHIGAVNVGLESKELWLNPHYLCNPSSPLKLTTEKNSVVVSGIKCTLLREEETYKYDIATGKELNNERYNNPSLSWRYPRSSKIKAVSSGNSLAITGSSFNFNFKYPSSTKTPEWIFSETADCGATETGRIYFTEFDLSIDINPCGLGGYYFEEAETRQFTTPAGEKLGVQQYYCYSNNPNFGLSKSTADPNCRTFHSRYGDEGNVNFMISTNETSVDRDGQNWKLIRTIFESLEYNIK